MGRFLEVQQLFFLPKRCDSIQTIPWDQNTHIRFRVCLGEFAEKKIIGQTQLELPSSFTKKCSSAILAKNKVYVRILKSNKSFSANHLVFFLNKSTWKWNGKDSAQWPSWILANTAWSNIRMCFIWCFYLDWRSECISDAVLKWPLERNDSQWNDGYEFCKSSLA